VEVFVEVRQNDERIFGVLQRLAMIQMKDGILSMLLNLQADCFKSGPVFKSRFPLQKKTSRAPETFWGPFLLLVS
jgi:hypothetical protein